MKLAKLSALHTSLLYLQETSLVLISVRGWVDPMAIVQPEGLSQWKIPKTTSGFKLVTFQLVVQCLNQLHHHIPKTWKAFKKCSTEPEMHTYLTPPVPWPNSSPHKYPVKSPNSMGQWWGNTDRKKKKYSEKSASKCHSFHHNPMWNGLRKTGLQFRC